MKKPFFFAAGERAARGFVPLFCLGCLFLFGAGAEERDGSERPGVASQGGNGPAKAADAFENRLAWGDGEDPQGLVKWQGPIRRETSEARSGSASLKLPGIAMATAPGLIELDPSKCYEISGYFKSAQPNQPSRMLLDVRFLTADKRPIDNWAIHPVSGVGATLGDALPGERVLRIAGTGWPTSRRPVKLALHAAEDLSDLPNFQTLGVSKYEVKEETCEVTLSKPLKEALPAGTKVRLHDYLDYARVFDNKVPYEWTRYAFRLVDKVSHGKLRGNYLWPGAKYARVAILHQYTEYPKPLPADALSPILIFDDLTFREVETEAEGHRP